MSLAGLFKRGGYDTFGYGKITHGWDQKEHWDDKVGHKRDPAPPGAPLAGLSRGEQDWGPIHLTEEQMNDTGGANKAIAVRCDASKPISPLPRPAQSTRPDGRGVQP